MPTRVRKHAPYFHGQAVVDGKIKEITLDDYQGQYLILLFYPMDFTYVSPTEILAFSDRAKEFYDYNCSIVGLSTDSEFTHLAWMKLSKEEGGLGGVINIALLSDKSMKISREYGVLDRDTGISHRGLYIIDSKGIIRHITMNDLEVGRSVEESLRLVKAFQFTDKYIKVCPVDWQPGDRGLRPDPMQTGRYFEGYFGIIRGKSNVQIKEIHQGGEIITVQEAKRSVRKSIKEVRVVGSRSAPSNNINAMLQSPSIDKENISEMDSSNLSQAKSPIYFEGDDFDAANNLKLYPKEFHAQVVADSVSNTRSYSLGHTSFPDNNLDYTNNIKGRPSTKKEYMLYSTIVPNYISLKNDPTNLKTNSKSDTTLKYNSQKEKMKIAKTESPSKNKEQQNSAAYLQDLKLKQYINDYYKNTKDKLIQDKNSSISREISCDKSPRYELKNDEVYKHNDRLSKDNELFKTRQNNHDRKDTKQVRRDNPGAKEDMNLQLDDVLNIKTIIANNSTCSAPVQYCPKYKTLQEDKFDTYQKIYQKNQRNYTKQQELNAEWKQRHQVNSISHSLNLKEQYEQVRYNQKDLEKNQVVIPPQSRPKTLQSSSPAILDSGYSRTIKPSMKRQSPVRQTNINPTKEGHYSRNVKPQYLEFPINQNANNQKYSYNKPSVSERNKNLAGKSSPLPKVLKNDLHCDMNGHLIM